MMTKRVRRWTRREFLKAAGTASAISALGLPVSLFAAGTKIGMIGSGRVGSTVGELWVKAGHEVMFSSLNLESDKALAAKFGRGARAGTSKEAAAFGEVVFVAVPYSAMPAVSRDLGEILRGKVVMDASNPIPTRDGPMAEPAREKGAGLASAEYFPGSRLVRAFNCIGWTHMLNEAHRPGAKMAIPLAADDAAAMQVAIRLVKEAGFEPVPVGGLARAKDFDWGTPIFGKPVTAAQAREILGVK